MTNPNLVSYKVDFNAVHPVSWNVLGAADGTDQSRLSPQVGDQVLLYDAEGNHCSGWIAEVADGLLQFRLDETTWRSGAEQIQIANAASRSLTAAPSVAK